MIHYYSIFIPLHPNQNHQKLTYTIRGFLFIFFLTERGKIAIVSTQMTYFNTVINIKLNSTFNVAIVRAYVQNTEQNTAKWQIISVN